jgi:ABC-type phosphate/phosphonate transport system ATPase subunit
MEVTMVGLQNAGKTSLLRVLAVSFDPKLSKLGIHGTDLILDREENSRSSKPVYTRRSTASSLLTEIST